MGGSIWPSSIRGANSVSVLLSNGEMATFGAQSHVCGREVFRLRKSSRAIFIGGRASRIWRSPITSTIRCRYCSGHGRRHLRPQVTYHVGSQPTGIVGGSYFNGDGAA